LIDFRKPDRYFSVIAGPHDKAAFTRMIIFPPDVDYPPEQLSKMSGIDFALMQHMLDAGCPTTDGRLSQTSFSRWTYEHYIDALSDFDVATLPKHGHFSEPDQYWIFAPVVEWSLRGDWLAVGGPGVDGIAWAVRKDRTGVYAFYPIEQEFVAVAEDGPELITKWTSGKLHL
jgi:hypothetical protein